MTRYIGRDMPNSTSTNTVLKDHNGTPIPSTKPSFKPVSGSLIKNLIDLPTPLCQSILQAPCAFPPSLFSNVLLNIIRNPNLTSPLLFRADIVYDSETDHVFNADWAWGEENGGAKWLKAELRPRWPRREEWEGWKVQRVLVRKLVPRNERRDGTMVQTCWFLRRTDDDRDGIGVVEHNMVVLVPHVDVVEEMPFYHPAVEQLAFLHSRRASSRSQASPEQSEGKIENREEQSGTLTLFVLPFSNSITSNNSTQNPSLAPIPDKIHRTAHILLQTIHKHATGLQSGYTKRVHHDRLIPQAQYQNTYSRLKSKYGRTISEQWVEVTDPGKHVFEDLGIASWCIEVWRMLYELPPGLEEEGGHGEKDGKKRPPFPGFVDIGCGNGLLTYIFLSEGYAGWGFDARERKTWSIFPPEIRSKLEQRVLVPRILQGEANEEDARWHDGYFEPGTFIISNHADELTAWTPLLGYLNDSSWMAIPCCSHDLGGKRFRAPASSRGMVAREKINPETFTGSPVRTEEDDEDQNVRLPQQRLLSLDLNREGPTDSTANEKLKNTQAAETGSLARDSKRKKMPSAYSTLCSYLSSLSHEVGYTPEEDILRIPSTRNTCILGRYRSPSETEINSWVHVREAGATVDGDGVMADERTRKEEPIKAIVEREMKMSVADVGVEWIARVEGLSVKGTGGH
ncbi:DUF1613-domain-containing protein [Zymoseptoria brevis]|uniref:tRNA (uracil-O(2)-)-methyltransferase n=1 Tax=Zymoseptoria brevis TaxID=1047168 RepID=A0A0F4GUD6_9PEZI|nr:DUF1613-domain-containing protein [Zymoseptoria brevis]